MIEKVTIEVISSKAMLNGRPCSVGSIVDLNPDVADWWIKHGLGKHPGKLTFFAEPGTIVTIVNKKEKGNSGEAPEAETDRVTDRVEEAGEENAESPAATATKSGNRKRGRPKATA